MTFETVKSSPDAAGSGGEAWPTDAMIEAGHAEWLKVQSGYPLAVQHRRVFLAMLKAKPVPDATQTREAELPADDDELAMALCEADGHDPHELTYHFTEPGVQEPYGDRWTHYTAQATRLRAALNGRGRA